MSEVEKCEQEIKDMKAAIARSEQALKLYRNRDFRELILEGFCVRDAAKYIQQAGDPSMGKAEREDAMNIALAAGHLKRFLSVQVLIGNNAKNQLVRMQEELDILRQEENLVGSGGEYDE